ncbi:hypothetical protein DL766_007578 [Monosporascus sp. MC13-8B]|nr:hypothetical protein DL766_007578 [Monosporascus sp. MC13-8B]
MHARRGAMYLLLATCLAAAQQVSAGGGVALDFHMEGLLLPRQSSSSPSSFNLQAFTGALGGFPAPATDYQSAVNRACDNQKNECARAANANKDAVDFAVSDCDRQNNECRDAGNGAVFTRFPTSSDAEFDFFCDE